MNKEIITSARESGLYLNGIDFIDDGENIYLLEINAVPGIQTPYFEFGINSPARLVSHIEKSIGSLK